MSTSLSGTTVTPTRTPLGLPEPMSEARIISRENWIYETPTEKLTLSLRQFTDMQPPIKKPTSYMDP
jgi:hypothetical protein